MDTITVDSVKARISALEKERDDFVASANNQIAAYNGALGELNRLIEPPKDEPKTDAS